MSFKMGLGGELMYSVDGMNPENLHSPVSVMIKGDILCWHCTVCWAWLYCHWKKLLISVFFFSIEHCMMVVQIKAPQVLGTSQKVFFENPLVAWHCIRNMRLFISQKFYPLHGSVVPDVGQGKGVDRKHDEMTCLCLLGQFVPAFP